MLPPLLVRNVTDNWGDQGRAWLTALPSLIDDIAADWELAVGEPHRMTFHWVASVRFEGRPAVLKLGVPDGHLSAEADALRIVDGDGAVRLLASDQARGAMLLERAFPGTPLARAPLADQAATEVLLTAARRFHRPPPASGHSLPHLRSLRRDLTGDDPMVVRAAGLFDELCASSPGDVVLHGDLHHGNVLSASRPGEPWLTIDPHGWVGDPGFDGGSMLFNPHIDRVDESLLRLVPARIEQQAASSGDRDRVVAWGFVAGVLSAVWSGRAKTRARPVAAMLEKQL